jgi:hypothetical protein
MFIFRRGKCRAFFQARRIAPFWRLFCVVTSDPFSVKIDRKEFPMKIRRLCPPAYSDGDAACCKCNLLNNSGIQLIVEELQRLQKRDVNQLEQEEYQDGKLALVAACYAEFAVLSDDERTEKSVGRDRYWPWEEEWWKPQNPLHDLVHAGALIASEIDRILKEELQPADQLPE